MKFITKVFDLQHRQHFLVNEIIRLFQILTTVSLIFFTIFLMKMKQCYNSQIVDDEYEITEMFNLNFLLNYIKNP